MLKNAYIWEVGQPTSGVELRALPCGIVLLAGLLVAHTFHFRSDLADGLGFLTPSTASPHMLGLLETGSLTGLAV